MQTFMKISCTKSLSLFWPESEPILVKRHTQFVFSVQSRHRHRFCLQVCIVFWAVSIRTRFLYVQIFHSSFLRDRLLVLRMIKSQWDAITSVGWKFIPVCFNETEYFLTRINTIYADQNLVPVCPDFFVQDSYQWITGTWASIGVSP